MLARRGTRGAKRVPSQLPRADDPPPDVSHCRNRIQSSPDSLRKTVIPVEGIVGSLLPLYMLRIWASPDCQSVMVWGPCWVDLGSIWGRAGVVSGVLWVHVGSIWGRFGAALGSFGGRVGGRVGVVLAKPAGNLATMFAGKFGPLTVPAWSTPPKERNPRLSAQKWYRP